MTPTIRFYRDQDDRPRVQATSDHSTLADYLASDLPDTASTAEVLQQLNNCAIDTGQEISGNSYTLILQPEQLTLESLFDDTLPPYQVPMAQAKLLLSAWIDFLDNDNLLALVPDF